MMNRTGTLFIPGSSTEKLTLEEKEKQDERTLRNLRCTLEFVQRYRQTEIEAPKSSDNHKDLKQKNTTNEFEKCKFKTELLLIDDENTTKEKRFYFGIRKLHELETKDSTEILLAFNDSRSGFIEFLNSDNISPKMMALLLKVLSKVCMAKELRILASLINRIISECRFIQKHIPQYLICLQRIKIDDIDVEGSFEGIVSFLSKFQQIQPVTASEELTIIIPTITAALEKLSKRNIIISPHIYRKIEALQSNKDSVLKEYDAKTRKRTADSEHLHSKLPPEDYRTIPILPTIEDFKNKRPFLRPNIVRGSYIDAMHYLDVQFRLLREDYVRPLRESIENFKASDNKKSTKKISVYKNVQVLCPFNTEGGVVHLISFDPKPFARVRWEVSKRLLLGSLLCLSSDNFESMLFATVAKRDPAQLKKGRLEIHFEQLSEEMFSISPVASFVMVESEAYFEAFCHTLTSLQKMNDLPLKDYIVNVCKVIEAPKYLTPVSSYDFCSTFETIKSLLAERIKFPVLKTEDWPSSEYLGLDYSQYSALTAALTKEFTVIQGPPGTGKTYIGLKITQMLLENSAIWKSREEGCPILVVCYTNHALDQFLEGILSFTDRVVRIGGRSNNETIKKYQLGELRREKRKLCLVPTHIYIARRQIMNKVKAIEQTLDYYTGLIERSMQQILPLSFLQPFMIRRHSQFFMCPENYDLLHRWLCIPNCLEMLTEEDKDDNTLVENDNFAVENEEDIDFELSLREIDNSEYSHVSTVRRDYMWKNVTRNKSKQSRYIRKQITSVDIMTNNEARKVWNLWNLESSARWRLYCNWVAQYAIYLLEIITDLQKSYHYECEKLRELRIAEDKVIINEAKVIGMTTTGAAKYQEYLQEVQPKIVIVEEAAEVLEAHIVTSLTAETQHLILIGDHQQLKPSPTVYELAVRFSLDVSLFERMINNGMDYYQLTKQHRMRPNIAKLLTPHIYRNLENHPSVEKYENISGLRNNMFFINHCYHEGDVVDTKSHSNVYEAKFLIALCKYLRIQGHDASNITVLTTYSGQLFTIRQLMKGEKLLERIRVTVVDNFQGEENDIILVSFVRSNEEGSIGFLKVSNRVCVALSRAKKGLYCIGNFELFVEESELWKNIVGNLEEQKAIGKSLILSCQNHPCIFSKVTTPDDFEKYAPDGGCTQPCNFRLTCGHVCSRLCHPDDRSHTQLTCKRQCDKILCDLMHKCPKLCYEECGKCVVPLNKTRQICGHTVSVPCHLNPNEYHCPFPCNKELICGHVCQKQCHEKCQPCLKKVEQIFDCGHHVMVPCCEIPVSYCAQRCNRELSCGHNCESECGKYPCPPCEYLVKKSFPCGHETETKCCDTKNDLARCEEACNKIMDCTHECQAVCCHEGICGPCNKPCKKTLHCGHRCVLKCRETCPELCEVCKSFVPKFNAIRRKIDSDFRFEYVMSESELHDLDYD